MYPFLLITHCGDERNDCSRRGLGIVGTWSQELAPNFVSTARPGGIGVGETDCLTCLTKSAASPGTGKGKKLPREPAAITDKRRVDPVIGRVRDYTAPGPYILQRSCTPR